MQLVTQEYEKWSINVKKALIDKKMSVVQLAKAIGMCTPNVSSVINCSLPKADAVKRVSEYLGISCPGEEESII